ncbi:unnamed protein product [Bursaphelenchus okinawaensis]|uniref:Uncharacterized protein n=1 Tax=Bursaphelenchus okinawaensis TaxID=465554 RepID=A0A811L1V0_9BILA|nr:unnamed protein product [Bursaphelenchus okinawaensis]CAG9114977.1 unnamed protein product [Bursaphelenchus okinawaensis]
MGVIGCNKINEVCNGKYCTFYRHRDLQKNPDRYTLKRSCSDTPFFTYGYDKQTFGVRNRCIRSISGNNEWMLQICDGSDYCNYDCNTNLKGASHIPTISLLHTVLVLPLIMFVL